MICKSCNSENTQKLSVIYENGTSNISTNSKTTGVGFGGEGFGIGTASTNTSGTSQSMLAQKVSPPEKNSYLLAGVTILIGVIFLFNVNALRINDFICGLIGVFLLGFGFKIFRVNYRYNSNAFPKKYLEWNKAWHCNKCGAIYSV